MFYKNQLIFQMRKWRPTEERVVTTINICTGLRGLQSTLMSITLFKITWLSWGFNVLQREQTSFYPGLGFSPALCYYYEQHNNLTSYNTDENKKKKPHRKQIRRYLQGVELIVPEVCNLQRGQAVFQIRYKLVLVFALLRDCKNRIFKLEFY